MYCKASSWKKKCFNDILKVVLFLFKFIFNLTEAQLERDENIHNEKQRENKRNNDIQPEREEVFHSHFRLAQGHSEVLSLSLLLQLPACNFHFSLTICLTMAEKLTYVHTHAHMRRMIGKLTQCLGL